MANIENSIRIAVEFAKKWEGLASSNPSSLKYLSKTSTPDTKVYAYYDNLGGVWTIGWGSTYKKDNSKFKGGDVITKREADDLIEWEMEGKEKAIRSFIPYQSLTDNEYATLISIAYNAGQGNLKASRITKALNSGKSKQEVADVIKDSIVTAQGKFVQGLKNRRIDESRLFLGQYNALYSYYLRNEKTINYGLLGIGIIIITATSYWYYKKNK
jgi:lysozyme